MGCGRALPDASEGAGGEARARPVPSGAVRATPGELYLMGLAPCDDLFGMRLPSTTQHHTNATPHHTSYHTFHTTRKVLESLMYDSLLSLGGFVVVLAMMVRHTRSYALALAGMVQISSTIPLAYFVYTRLQQVEEVRSPRARA